MCYYMLITKQTKRTKEMMTLITIHTIASLWQADEFNYSQDRMVVIGSGPEGDLENRTGRLLNM